MWYRLCIGRLAGTHEMLSEPVTSGFMSGLQTAILRLRVGHVTFQKVFLEYATFPRPFREQTLYNWNRCYLSSLTPISGREPVFIED